MDLKPAARRPEVVLTLLVLGFFVLLTLQARRGSHSVLGNLALAAFGPLLSAYDSASRLTREGFQAYVWQRDAALQAERLAAENRALQGQLELSRNIEREVLTLRDLVQAPRPQGYDVIGGRALTQYGAPFSRYLLVSCDRKFYVAEGTAAMGPGGAVGRVQGASGGLYKVVLLTDPSSAAGVVCDRSGAKGVAVGKGSDMDVRWVSNESDVRVGDQFSTSGEDGVFPPGLRVGTAVSVEDGGDYLKRITLAPSSKMDDLTWVLLLRKSGG
jgi:rod shape-determining protein MreC